MLVCVNVGDHDLFVLKAIVDRVEMFGVPLGLPDKSFTKCEVFVPGYKPGLGTAPSGSPVCFVEWEIITDDLRFYSDATKTTELLRVKARPANGAFRKMAAFFSSGQTYDVTQADGTKIGVITRAVGERRYHISDASEIELVIVTQDPEPLSLREVPARLLLKRPFANDRFAFWHGDRRVGSHEPDRRTQTDSTVDMTPDREHMIDRRLCLAVGCLDVLRPKAE